MKGYAYSKTKEGYTLYFPELLNLRLPKKQYLGPDTEPITLTDQMMTDLCQKLNNGEIKVHCEDISLDQGSFRLIVKDNGELEKIIKE